MAEILLSLTIIGVVAAITLPSLTGNINERTWNTQRKALYARMSQAISLMPALNGYGTLTEDESHSVTADNVAETFVTAGLSKVLKINNICDSEHLTDCGIVQNINTLTGEQLTTPTTMKDLNERLTSASYGEGAVGMHESGSHSMINTKAAAFETQNGESILTFYNPSCVSNMGETADYFVQPKICVNMIYDLNGTKGPNSVGKDIGFMTILYPTDSSVVAPMPFRKVFDGVDSTEASAACTTNAGSEYRIPTKDELASLYANKKLLGTLTGGAHWFSSSKGIKANRATNWLLVTTFGEYRLPSSTADWSVFCVER